MYTVYSKPHCTYCEQAKKLLTSKGLAFEEKIVDVGQSKEDGKTYVSVQELKAVVPTASSVPQILQDGKLIGGFTQLKQQLG